ncbi:MAG: addiction module protein [Pirellulales bacterium]|jgi:putative addiction module component (TIGR02574 family)
MSMSDYQSVRSAAAELSITDQLRLIDDIAASMPDDQPPSLSEEWLAELERRSAEIDSGAARTESWSDIRKRLMHRVGLDDRD